MKVTVISDGETFGTQIFDANGNYIDGVTEIKFHQFGGEAPSIDIHLSFSPFTANGHAKMMGPHGREVKRIVYVDGAVDKF